MTRDRPGCLEVAWRVLVALLMLPCVLLAVALLIVIEVVADDCRDEQEGTVMPD